MSDNSIVRLAQSIGYPDKVPTSASSFTLKVDGFEVVVRTEAGRLVLVYRLGVFGDEGLLRLAGYAAGRILREEATLAWEPSDGSLILWQGAPSDAGAVALRSLFEDFTHACDWWRDRVSDIEAPPAAFPEVMIRP